MEILLKREKRGNPLSASLRSKIKGAKQQIKIQREPLNKSQINYNV